MVKKRIVWSRLAALLLLLPAFTADAKGQGCSVATLKGMYGDLEQGIVIAQLPGLPAPPFPTVLSGIITFDGKGNVSATFSASFNGAIAPGTATGTYAVNPDCTYSDEITPSSGPVSHHAGIISGGGMLQELNFVYTDAWLVATGTARKTVFGPCSLATLKGTYGFLEQGTITVQLPGFPPPPVPYVGFGIITFDGDGNAAGIFTTNMAGQTVSATGTGSYMVNGDCTYSDQLTALGLTSTDAGVITGEGASREVQYMNSGAGFVTVGTIKRR